MEFDKSNKLQAKKIKSNNYKIAKHWIPKTDIDIFLLKVSDNIDQINLSIIPQEQKSGISKYHHSRDKRKRLLARSFLFTYCRDNFQLIDYEFSYNKYKKPFFKESDIQFSFSYSRDYVLIGISKRNSIGVDIEYKNKDSSFEDIAPMVMHEEELENFNGLLDVDRVDFFYDLWSKKEAYIKAIGKGLYYDLKKINITYTNVTIEDNIIKNSHKHFPLILNSKYSINYANK